MAWALDYLQILPASQVSEMLQRASRVCMVPRWFLATEMILLFGPGSWPLAFRLHLGTRTRQGGRRPGRRFSLRSSGIAGSIVASITCDATESMRSLFILYFPSSISGAFDLYRHLAKPKSSYSNSRKPRLALDEIKAGL